MRHVESHPRPRPGCFGCRVLTVGVQAALSASNGRLTKTRTDDHGTHRVDVTEHWHDRQDVLVKAPSVHADIPRSTLDG